MCHNLINNIHVPFVHNVHIIVNRIKIEIRRMVEKKQSGKFVGNYFRKNLLNNFKQYQYIYPRHKPNLLFLVII